MTEFPGHEREDGFDFCRRLIEEVGVAAVPGGAFYDRSEDGAHLVRFSFSKSLEILSEAVRRLQALT
jgi:aspartate/methionine/tyrosine aminotransferase